MTTFPFVPPVEKRPVVFYEFHIKRALIAAYINTYISQLEPDDLVDSLHRILRLKKKAIRYIAAYAKNDVEVRGHPLDTVVGNLAFFAVVFRDYIDKDNGQPLHKFYTPIPDATT